MQFFDFCTQLGWLSVVKGRHPRITWDEKRVILFWKEGCWAEKRELATLTLELVNIKIHIYYIPYFFIPLFFCPHWWFKANIPNTYWAPTHCQWCQVLENKNEKMVALKSSLPSWGDCNDIVWPPLYFRDRHRVQWNITQCDVGLGQGSVAYWGYASWRT